MVVNVTHLFHRVVTRINFNHSMDKYLHPLEFREWTNNFFPQVNGHVITYPCWDKD